ncbi:Unknown protein, partial [Striga hermonthica]
NRELGGFLSVFCEQLPRVPHVPQAIRTVVRGHAHDNACTHTESHASTGVRSIA